MHAYVKSRLTATWMVPIVAASPHRPFQLSKDQGLLRVIGKPSLRNMLVVFIAFLLFIVSFLGVAVASDQIFRSVSVFFRVDSI